MVKYQKTAHAKFGFVEPLIYYTPSIAISEIENVNKFFTNKETGLENYFVGSLGKDIGIDQMSIHHLIFDYEKNKLNRFDIINIEERIRDLKYIDDLNSIILFLESSGSIGILKKIN